MRILGFQFPTKEKDTFFLFCFFVCSSGAKMLVTEYWLTTAGIQYDALCSELRASFEDPVTYLYSR